MFRRSALCLLVVLVSLALMPGDAAAQYGGGSGGGYYGGGGGYHAEDRPRRERQGQRSGGQNPNGKQCYTKRSKAPDGSWRSEKVCE